MPEDDKKKKEEARKRAAALAAQLSAQEQAGAKGAGATFRHISVPVGKGTLAGPVELTTGGAKAKFQIKPPPPAPPKQPNIEKISAADRAQREIIRKQAAEREKKRLEEGRLPSAKSVKESAKKEKKARRKSGYKMKY